MTTDELRDRLDTWLSLTHQTRIPASSNPVAAALKAQTEAQWDAGMLNNAAALEVTAQLCGTPAEVPLAKAIQMAKRSDSALLSQIEEYLRSVQKWMSENGM